MAKNLRLLAVIFAALLFFNAFTTLFSPVAETGTCGSLIRPFNDATGDLEWFSSNPACPKTTDNARVEFWASLIVGVLVSGALVAESAMSKRRKVEPTKSP